MLVSVESLLAEMNRLHAYVSAVLERGEVAGDDRLILAGVAQGMHDCEALARLGTSFSAFDRTHSYSGEDQ